jgi:DNA repair photolyase
LLPQNIRSDNPKGARFQSCKILSIKQDWRKNMGENSKIEWTDHTFNPWIGCQHVSPGCDHCYAEAMMDHRYGKVEWGPHGERKRTSDENWKKPIRWNANAQETVLSLSFGAFPAFAPD